MAEIFEWVNIRWQDGTTPSQASSLLGGVPGVLPQAPPPVPTLPDRVPVVRSTVDRVCSILRARAEIAEVTRAR